MNNDHPNGVMVALLPSCSEWCKMDLPHLTVVYVGKVDDLNPTLQNDLAKEAVTLSRMFNPLTLDVLRPDTLPERGDPEEVDVLKLLPSPELLIMRKVVERYNGSEFKEFLPHVTVGPVGSIDGNVPSRIEFDRISVWWGKNSYIFRFCKEPSVTPAYSY